MKFPEKEQFVCFLMKFLSSATPTCNFDITHDNLYYNKIQLKELVNK